MRIALTAIFCLAIGFAAGWQMFGTAPKLASESAPPLMRFIVIDDEVVLHPEDFSGFQPAEDGDGYNFALKPDAANEMARITGKYVGRGMTMVFGNVLDDDTIMIREQIFGGSGIAKTQSLAGQAELRRLAKAVAASDG